MVEMGYATNPEEGTRLATEEYQIKLANALADGVEAFARVMNPGTALQVQKAPVVETPPPAPVKVDPAPPKKTASPAKKTQPRQKAPRRRASSAPKKTAPKKPAPKKNNKRRR